MQYQDIYWRLAGVTQHAEFEQFLKDCLFDKQRREKFYMELVSEIGGEARFEDTFKPYFEEYAAERKSNKQDYTPSSVTEIIAKLTRANGERLEKAGYTAYDPTAGTGAIIIKKWADDVLRSNFGDYRPHDFFYWAEEIADNAIIYLLHNFLMRGMNAIVIHGDTLERTAKTVYFIQNSNDDFMSFSDLNIMPRTDDVARYFNIREWDGKEVEHIESETVTYRPRLSPLPHEAIESVTPVAWLSNETLPAVMKPMVKLNEVATVERAQSKKVYPAGAVIVQISATRGQTGLLTSYGKVPSHYAVAVPKYGISGGVLWGLMKAQGPHHFYRVQEGLNIKLHDIETMPLAEEGSYWGIWLRMRTPEGQRVTLKELDVIDEGGLFPPKACDYMRHALANGEAECFMLSLLDNEE